MSSEAKKRALSSSEEQDEHPSKRIMEKNRSVHLTKLPSSEFIDAFMKYQKEPNVTVTVEGKKFMLPKQLLYDRSPFFDGAFNGKFQESITKALDLKEAHASTFEHIIRWMILGCARIHLESSSKPEELSKATSQYVEYFMLADRLGLEGDFKPDASILKKVIKKWRLALTAEHLRTAANPPKDHILRATLAQACVKEYFGFLSSDRPFRCQSKPFRYQAEMDGLEGFASDLLQAFHSASKGVAFVTTQAIFDEDFEEVSEEASDDYF
ncbi:hypothetical protein HYALB_00003774 [Hymenoscyphus albidus]|uniref:BTB domain-containing protein n=1 Tax=Hymenoscyphus albidus TaxID=595503 RepID=A0A9N9LTE5_9HELO|nr:hypothetical protein HYALB_00003774 [Hymenoscyphus albidus]